MKTSKNRGGRNKRKTLKGGDYPNKKAYIVVNKSNINPDSENLLYKIILARPTFNFLDYFTYNMELVDESLAAIKPKNPVKDTRGNPIVEKDTVYIEEIEVGNNKTKRVNEKEAKQKDDEDDE